MIETEAYHYTKDKNGKKTGNTICVLIRENRIFFGEAICAKEDQFSKSVGRNTAKKKAYESYVRWIEARELHEKRTQKTLIEKAVECFYAISKL